MHNIQYFSYDEKVNRRKVEQEANEYVTREDWQEGCSGLYNPIRWLENVGICADYEAAQHEIEIRDRHDYDNLAVRYYEPVRGFTDKRYEELKLHAIGAHASLNEKNKLWVQTVKAEFVGCRNCGSRLKRELIKSNQCPVCFSDLRPETTLKQVASAQAKLKKAQNACKEYERTHAKKAVKWLVKIEYHT